MAIDKAVVREYHKLMSNRTTLSLEPASWQVGDLIWHRSKRRMLATVAAIKSTNRHHNRFRVDWTDQDGDSGHFFILNQGRELVQR